MKNVPPSVRAALNRRGASAILDQEGDYQQFKPQIDAIIHKDEDMSGYIADTEAFGEYDDDLSPEEKKATDRIEELGDKFKSTGSNNGDLAKKIAKEVGVDSYDEDEIGNIEAALDEGMSEYDIKAMYKEHGYGEDDSIKQQLSDSQLKELQTYADRYEGNIEDYKAEVMKRYSDIMKKDNLSSKDAMNMAMESFTDDVVADMGMKPQQDERSMAIDKIRAITDRINATDADDPKGYIYNDEATMIKDLAQKHKITADELKEIGGRAFDKDIGYNPEDYAWKEAKKYDWKMREREDGIDTGGMLTDNDDYKLRTKSVSISPKYKGSYYNPRTGQRYDFGYDMNQWSADYYDNMGTRSKSPVFKTKEEAQKWAEERYEKGITEITPERIEELAAKYGQEDIRTEDRGYGPSEIGRTIHTGLTGKEDLEVLQSTLGQLSDGIWENSRAAERFWKNLDVYRNDDGEIVIDTKTSDYNSPFRGKTPQDVMKYLAQKAKQVVKTEIDDGADAQWDRNSDYQLDYMSGHTTPVKISDVYRTYDRLLGRKQRQPKTETKAPIKHEVPDEVMKKYEKEFPGMNEGEKALIKTLYMKGMLK